MQLLEFDKLIRGILDFESLKDIDCAVNGLQVERTGKIINKVTFSVDTSMESFRQSLDWGSDLLFVHHGIFWREPSAIKNTLYSRIKYLMDNDLALYAVHLPLDIHPELGNNACIARQLKLNDIQPFGDYHGTKIGYKGTLPEAKKINEIMRLVCGKHGYSLKTLPFGPENIRTIGIVSGGAPKSAYQAIAENLDLFITGNSSHEIYHECLEAKMNVIFGGHYSTEIWGVRAMAEYLNASTKLETKFIDIPTGL